MRLPNKYIVIMLLFMPFSALLSSTKEERDRAVLQSFVNEVADSLKKSDSDDNNINLLNQLLTQSTQNGYAEGQIFAHKSLAQLYYLKGQYGKCLSENFAALNFLINNKKSSELGEAYRRIGETYRAVFNREKALAFLDTAGAIFTSIGDFYGLANVKNRQAAVKFEQSSLAEASALCRESNRLLGSAKTAAHIKEELYGNNFNIIAKTFPQNSDSAFYYYKKSIESYNNSHGSSDICMPLINIAIAYLYAGKADSSLKYGLQAYDISRKRNIKPYGHHSAIVAASSYYALGEYKLAYEYLKIGTDIRVALLTEKTESKVADVQKSMETAITQTEFMAEQKKAEYLGIIAISILLLSGITIFVLRKKSVVIKRKNAELSAAYKLIFIKNQDLDELNATKDKFFSLIAHDLKNPLGAIKFLSETLEINYGEIEEGEKREYITEIAKTSHHLNLLLENLLSWARSQQGKVKFNPERNDLGTLINTVIMLMESAAKKKSIKIQFNGQIEKPIIIDANMINTVLRNLVSNAIKFTDEGGLITISAKEAPTSDNGRVALVSVQDNGIGMTAGDIEKLFKIDKVFSKLGTKEEKGTGLGLILSKEFVERHGGSIWVESEYGKGSCFKFTIPSSAGKN